MKKINLYIGLNDKDSKKQEISTVEAFKIVQKTAINLFGGGTIYEVMGFYTHDDGTLIEERSLKLEIVDVENKKVLEFINVIKTVLNQESILKTEQNIESCYVSQEKKAAKRRPIFFISN